ncbi:MAG TPA: cytochrome c, partial [Blastocatellia bacterium]|nr:cytochrome c [Blastocatellia bacterium]
AIAAFVACGMAILTAAQQPGPPNPAPPQGGRGRGGPQFDAGAASRGQTLFVAQCGFCHGTNATGGQSGPDLIRSVLVMGDENGKQLGDFLKVGRVDKGMPKFEFSQEQYTDIATFLHQRIAAAADRGSYKILDILVGDAKAGEAYFNGAGKCNTCHSVTDDLKGIGARYDPATLQGRIVMPRQRMRFGRGREGSELPRSNAVTVTVTLNSGESFSGVLVRLTDFDVTLRDSSGVLRSFTRDGDSPKVETRDPLQAHVDMLGVWKDSDIHNMTAYLVTLK